MKKAFLSNLGLLLFFNLLIKPLYIFGVDRAIQNNVGQEAYGLYFTWFNFTFIFQILSDLGTTYFNNSNLSQNRHLLQKYFPNIFQLKLILSILYTLVCWVAGWLFGYQGWAFLGMIVIQLLVSMILFLRTNLSGMGYYRWDSYVSVADKFLLIFSIGAIFIFPSWGEITIDRFIQIQVLTYAFVLAIVIFLNKHIGVNFIGKWDWARVHYFFKKSYPFALVVLLMTLYTRSDAVFIEKILPDGAFHAGVYAAAYRLLDASNMIGYLFAALLLPMFARVIKTKEDLGGLIVTSLKLISSFSLGLSVSVFFWRNELIRWLNPEATDYWGDVLGFLMLTFIPVSFNYIFGTFLTANHSLKKMYPIFLIGIALNIFLNFLLIPQLHALGAAISTLVTQSFIAWRQIVLCYKETALQLTKVFSKMLLYVVGIVVLSFLIYNYMEMSNWSIGFVINGLLIVVWCFVIKMLSKQDFKAVI